MSVAMMSCISQRSSIKRSDFGGRQFFGRIPFDRDRLAAVDVASGAVPNQEQRDGGEQRKENQRPPIGEKPRDVLQRRRRRHAARPERAPRTKFRRRAADCSSKKAGRRLLFRMAPFCVEPGGPTKQSARSWSTVTPGGGKNRAVTRCIANGHSGPVTFQ